MKTLSTEEKMMLPVTDLQATLEFLKEHERFKAMMEKVRLERNRQSNLYHQRRKQLLNNSEFN
jgi:hypothetical protein